MPAACPTAVLVCWSFRNSHRCSEANRRIYRRKYAYYLKKRQPQVSPIANQGQRSQCSNKNIVDRWADYEDEIHNLRIKPKPGICDPAVNRLYTAYFRRTTPSPANLIPTNTESSLILLNISQIDPNLKAVQAPVHTVYKRLVEALTREQKLRQAAEGKLDEASGELEELSAQCLCKQMRWCYGEKSSAKLEERVRFWKGGIMRREEVGRLESACRDRKGQRTAGSGQWIEDEERWHIATHKEQQASKACIRKYVKLAPLTRERRGSTRKPIV